MNTDEDESLEEDNYRCNPSNNIIITSTAEKVEDRGRHA